MTIRSGGLASGLDTNALIEQLVGLERRPITTLQAKKSAQQTQISAIAKIKAALQKVQDKAKALDSTDEVMLMKASSSDETAFGVSATAGAGSGTYEISVTALAKAAKIRSAAIANTDLAVKAGTVSVSVKGGDSQSVTISDGDTLADVAAKFNEEIEGASATVINDGTNSYLSITADETGHAIGEDPSTALIVSTTYSGSSGSELGLATTQAAQNATMTVDGVTVTNPSNSVSTAVEGLTFDLKATTVATKTATISADSTGMETKIKELVDAYNEAIDVLAKETTVTAATDRARSLAGDPTVRGIRTGLSASVTASIASLSTAVFDSFSAIGIKSKSSGKLEIDSTALKAALAKSTGAVAAVFSASDSVTKRIQTDLKQYTDSQGVLKARTQGLNDSISSIEDQIEKMTLRVERYQQNLVRQFTSLETAMNDIQRQSGYLSGLG